jgi:hypothetical protein
MLAGIPEHVALRHLRYSKVRVDGLCVVNPDAPAPDPTVVQVHGVEFATE